MMKNLFFAWSFLCSFISYSQVVINELDADTPSTDTKEFIELKSTTPFFSLDGYTVVFFNGTSTGTSNLSYYAIDLDGLVTDGNGIILLGNLQVVPSASYTIPQATIENGPDAVAIYQGDAVDFPKNTVGTTTNLIDAFAYSNNNTAKATQLMADLGIAVSYNENINSLAASQSFQRKADGTFEVKTPTPRANNDGSGIIYNGITTSLSPVSPLTEGQSITITFKTDAVVSSDLNFAITLKNGSFTTSDYSGNLNIKIPSGSDTASTVIQLLNDGVNEGDEEMVIKVGTIPSTYIVLNNNITVRVNDINFEVSSFGTPASPTYGNVTSTAPIGYYSSIEGLSGSALKQALQNIIANPSVVRAHTYGDVYTILNKADQNPANSNQVWLIYTEQPRSKIDLQSGNSIVGKWNREHIYPQSRGNYGDLYNLPPAGINKWTLSSPDDIGAGLTDAHHLRAADGQENSSRNNRNYGIDYNGPIGNPGTWRGDVARAVFYMVVRYNGLSVVNGNPSESIIGQIGDLTTLLDWNKLDRSDDFEMNRNNYIYTWQMNRNPFIDYPDLADYIWGTKVGQKWYSTLSTSTFSKSKMSIYPNPAKDYITVSGISNTGTIQIYNVSGAKLYENQIKGETQLNINLASGVYLVKISSDTNIEIKKLVIE